MNFTDTLTLFTNRISAALPGVLGALIILLIGWLIAKGIQKLVVNLMRRTSWDEKLLKGVANGEDTNRFVGKLFYYVILVIVFLIVLEMLGIHSVLEPLEDMVNKFLTFIPNIVAAGIIGFVGYMLASLLSGLVAALSGLIGRLVAKMGVKNADKTTDQIVKVLKSFAFIIVFIPLLIQAINTLQMKSIGEPLNNLMDGFVGIVGNIILAAIILTIFIWGGRVATNFLKKLFKDLGLDGLAKKIYLENMIGEKSSLSNLIGNIIYFFIVFFGIITAVNVLQLEPLTEILNQILAVTGSIAFGGLILLVGNFIGMLVYNIMSKSNKNLFVASVVRIAIMGLFLGIGLRAMGIANEIVNLAFGLTLGSLAVVIALAYGLGGREAAGEHFKEIIAKFKGEDKIEKK